jgi:hypothetical protein
MQAVGWVSAVRGRVTAVDEHGSARQLRPDTAVYADETLIAALDGAISICLYGGAELYLAPGSLLVLDADVFEDEDAVDDGRLQLADVRRVLSWRYAAVHRSVA